MMLGKIGRRIRIGASERLRLVGSSRRFPTNNKAAIEPTKNGEKTDGALTHHDSYRDLDKLDFMTAAKILFTTPPKQKKFGYFCFFLLLLYAKLLHKDSGYKLHICTAKGPVPIQIGCVNRIKELETVYLVAQYARHEMKKMDADLEKKQVEEAKKTKAAEGEALQSNPQLLEVKERLDSLEKTVKEIMTESKTQRNIKVSDRQEGDRKQHASSPVGSDRPKIKQETYDVGDQKGSQAQSARDEK
ncbi:hypothetical protein OSB04_021620 [Centaurea solstitialis]|uniref:Uncharacterized protein n=1 Tax=Centaurea solstitialis TaxID=347529 RepID=A0AA38W6X3_9ASTR|nr:hypothetical protein OSB04_021620 [Centaurea solstitialis]